ncbi:MAG: hypothetical protein ABEI98_03255 [Halorhabdus sp.]
MEFHPEELFSAPGGWESARIFLLAAVAFGILGFVDLLADTDTTVRVILALGMGIGGIAELLSTHRRRLAGVTRLVAIAILLSALGTSLLSLVS